MTQNHISIVVPTFNDWASLARLIKDIDTLPELVGFHFGILIVDDGSNDRNLDPILADSYSRIQSMTLVELGCNLGHQRAIAIGLVQALKLQDTGCIIVMDSDGEDRPQDIKKLVDHWRTAPNSIVCAQRARRSESISFKMYYFIYKLVFKMLTGARIDFGNFCLIPQDLLAAVCHHSSSWNNLAATLVRSRLPIRRIPTDRGRRYAGRSHMNLVSLIMHGMSAISVYSDVVLVRMLIGLLGLSALSIVGLAVVFALRLFTDLAVPGWASGVAGNLFVIFLQSVVFALISAFIMLSTRSMKTVVPIVDADTYVIRRLELIRGNAESVKPVAISAVSQTARRAAHA
jgi:polyisoprenyl-phosphate glycosyltransferase